MSEFVDVNNLDEPIRRALEAVGFRKSNIEVITAETVVLGDSGVGGGYRSFTALVNLSNGEHTIHTGSWGGINMFDRTNPVDNDDAPYRLPANGLAIKGWSGGGKPTHARIYIPASMTSRLLPQEPPTELPKVQLDALYCHGRIKGGTYRRDELRRRSVPASVVDDLVGRGLLSRNRAGATAITTAGRNALGEYRGY